MFFFCCCCCFCLAMSVYTTINNTNVKLLSKWLLLSLLQFFALNVYTISLIPSNVSWSEFVASGMDSWQWAGSSAAGLLKALLLCGHVERDSRRETPCQEKSRGQKSNGSTWCIIGIQQGQQENCMAAAFM